MQSKNVLALRYSTQATTNVGTTSYHVIYRGTDYPLEALTKKARYDVRKGQQHAIVKAIDFRHLATEGWNLRKQTLIRQGRTNADNAENWHRLCVAAEGLDGFEAWAAFHDGKMVASLIGFLCDDCYSILYQQSATQHLIFGVNNSLLFHVMEALLTKKQVKRVFYGLASLDAPESVDNFKIRMNFEKEVVRQRVIFHPLIQPLVRESTYQLVTALHRLLPENAKLAKTGGLIRLYLNKRQSQVKTNDETGN